MTRPRRHALVLVTLSLAAGILRAEDSQPPGPDWEAREISYDSARPAIDLRLYVHVETRALQLVVSEGGTVRARWTPESPNLYVHPAGVIVAIVAGAELGVAPAERDIPLDFEAPPVYTRFAYHDLDGAPLADVETTQGFVAYSPERGHGLFARQDGKIACHDGRGAKLWERALEGGDAAPTLEFPPPGRFLAVLSSPPGSEDGSGLVHLIDLETGDRKTVLSTSFKPYPTVAWAGDDEILVAHAPGGGWNVSILRFAHGERPEGKAILETNGYPEAAWVLGADRVVLLKAGNGKVELQYYAGGRMQSFAGFDFAWRELSLPHWQLQGTGPEIVRLRLGNEIWTVDFSVTPPERKKQ